MIKKMWHYTHLSLTKGNLEINKKIIEKVIWKIKYDTLKASTGKIINHNGN